MALRITYEAARFPSSLHPQLDGRHELEVTWPQLIHSAITVGRGDWPDVFQHGRHSMYEIVFRASMVYFSLKEADGRLRKTDAFTALDPSEKGAVSYFLGLAVAKLFSEHLLGVPWLMHLAVYRDRFEPVDFRTTDRPDLIGFDQSKNLVVMEAKGRTHRVNGRVMERAKQQVEALRKMREFDPRVRVALCAFFRADALTISVEDPEGSTPASFDLNLTIYEFLHDYYHRFVELLRDGELERRGRRTLRTVEVPLVGMTLGLDDSLIRVPLSFRRLVSFLPKLDQPLSSRSKEPVGGAPDRSYSSEFHYHGGDGIAVTLDSEYWGSEVMSREPRERRLPGR